MLERIKKIKLRYWIYAAISLIFFFLFLFDFRAVSNHNLITYILYALVFVFIAFIVFVAILKFNKINPDSYYKYYFALVLIMGITYMLLSPPFTSSDE